MNTGFIIENRVLKATSSNESNACIPAEVVRIGKAAFKGSVVESVSFLGNNLKSIDEEAFANCTKLKTLVIPDGVVQIGDRAFAGCSELNYIAIPDSVMVIGDGVLDNCKNDLFIIGKEGSEASAFASRNGLVLNTDHNKAIAAFEQSIADKAEIKTLIFDIFGESVRCSNTLIKYHNNMEYYASRKESVFQSFYKALPLTIPSDFGDMLSVLKSEENNAIRRLYTQGVFIKPEALSNYLLEPYQALLNAVTAIKDAYVAVASDIANGINDNRTALFNEAERKVTGLSYGIIGDGLDMITYSIDDYLERQRQRKEAYSEAKKRADEFKLKHTSNGNRIYTEFIAKSIPYIHQGTDMFIDALCRAENDLLMDAGLIDRDFIRSIDIQKSAQLIDSIKDQVGDNSFTVGLSLKKYPHNIAALVYAKERYTCAGIDALIDFLGIKDKIKKEIDEAKATRFSNKEQSISKVDGNEGVRRIKVDESVLTEYEVIALLKLLSNTITNKVETLASPKHVNAIVDPAAYSKAELAKEITQDSWNYFLSHGVKPISSSRIPVAASSDYSALTDWITENVSKKVNRELRYKQYTIENPEVIEKQKLIKKLEQTEKAVRSLKDTNSNHMKTVCGSFIAFVCAVISIIGLATHEKSGDIVVGIIFLILTIVFVLIVLIPSKAIRQNKKEIREIKARLKEIDAKKIPPFID